MVREGQMEMLLKLDFCVKIVLKIDYLFVLIL